MTLMSSDKITYALKTTDLNQTQNARCLRAMLLPPSQAPQRIKWAATMVWSGVHIIVGNPVFVCNVYPFIGNYTRS